jgi:hypothetical protein
MREIASLARPGDTVLRVPADCDPAFESYQVFHHAPVVGCAGSFAANPWSKLTGFAHSAAVAKLRCERNEYGRIPTADGPMAPFGSPDVEELRERFGVRFIVVDRSMLGFGCPAVRAVLPVLERHRSLGGDGRFEIIDLSRPAR